MKIDQPSRRAVLAAGTATLALFLPVAAVAQQGIAESEAEQVRLDTDRQIVVTAQKRTELISEVPQSISVVSEDTLIRQQAESFVDYVELVPSLSLTQSTPGETRVILRGVNTGSVGSTVAIYVDETPFGSSSSLGNAAVLAGDFDTFDLQRVEVLRGPQGTLYGSNALGGVIRFVTNAPVLGEFEGRAQAGIESVKNGGTGWSANGVVNVPLGENFAVRASGFYRQEAGFIDVIGRDPEGLANEAEIYGGRISALFEPTETLSFRLTALAQNIRAGSPGSFDADPETLEPVTVDPTTDRPLRQGLFRTEYYPEFNDVDYRLYNGTIDWDLGFATLTSVTSLGKLDQNQLSDSTVQLGPTVTFVYQTFGDRTDELGAFIRAPLAQEKFTQEVRLSSSDSDRFEWQLGAYYTDEQVELTQNLLPFVLETADLINPAVLGFDDLLILSLDSEYEEVAGFGNATFHVTPRWEVSGGARYSHNEQTAVQTEIGAFQPLQNLPSPNITSGESQEDVFTWSLSTRFELSDLSSAYARVAKGYRPGGPNVVPPGAGSDFPFQYDADTLVSYEVGLRGETPDRSLTFDGAVYYLDWSNILVFGAFDTAIGPVGANDNGGGARVYGAEATVTLRPVAGLSLVANSAYNDAQLTEDTPPVTGGLEGDELPYTPRFTATASADYEWPVGGDTVAFVGGDVRYVSEQAGGFDQDYRELVGNRLTIDDYTKIDLRAGVAFENVSLTFFVRNLTESRGLTSADGLGTRPNNLLALAPIRPRTVGVTAAASF